MRARRMVFRFRRLAAPPRSARSFAAPSFSVNHGRTDNPIAAIGLSVRPWFTENEGAAKERADLGGAASLLNRNTILLALMTVIGGLVIYGYLGMYPTFLREALKYSPATAGTVMSMYGLGALVSIGGGWLGDRFSPRIVLTGAFLATAVLGYLLFHTSGAVAEQV